MIYLDMLKRQHEEILSILSEIKGIIRSGNLEENAAEAANLISILAGKLRVHLNAEDELMYPSLLNSNNPEIRSTAGSFTEEMGNISKVVSDYKERYNTRTKILTNKYGFATETENILSMLEKRIEKENSILYPMIKG